MTEIDKKTVFENKYCKVTWISGHCPYLLQSKTGKFQDRYCLDLSEVSHLTMIPVRELAAYNPVSG